MLRSVRERAILLSARSSVVRAYSSRPRMLRLVPFIVIAILFFPLIASLKEQAALAQTYPAQTYPAQTYPGQSSPGQTYPQSYPAHAYRARAQASRASRRAVLAQQQAPERKYNEGRLMILGGYPGTTCFNLVHDMAAALAGGDDLRLLAVDPPRGIETPRDLPPLLVVHLAPVPQNVPPHPDTTTAPPPHPP